MNYQDIPYDDNTVFVEGWEDLKTVTSDTHYLDISDCNGWIRPKEENKRKHYLSTHTFYDQLVQYYEELLRSCGFNIILKNWDAKEIKR